MVEKTWWEDTRLWWLEINGDISVYNDILESAFDHLLWE